MTLDDIRVEDLRVTMQRVNDEYFVIEVNARLITHGKQQVVNVQKVGDALAGAIAESEVRRGNEG